MYPISPSHSQTLYPEERAVTSTSRFEMTALKVAAFMTTACISLIVAITAGPVEGLFTAVLLSSLLLVISLKPTTQRTADFALQRVDVGPPPVVVRYNVFSSLRSWFPTGMRRDSSPSVHVPVGTGAWTPDPRQSPRRTGPRCPLDETIRQVPNRPRSPTPDSHRREAPIRMGRGNAENMQPRAPVGTGGIIRTVPEPGTHVIIGEGRRR